MMRKNGLLRLRHMINEADGTHELRNITFDFNDVLKALPNGSIWIGYVQKIGQPMPRGEEGRRQMAVDNIQGIYYARKTMAHIGRPSSVASALQLNADRLNIPKSKIQDPTYNNYRGMGNGIVNTNANAFNSQESFYINEEPHNSMECYFRVFTNGKVETISEYEAIQNGVIGKGLGNIGGTNEDYRYILSNVAFISYNDTPSTVNKKGARVPKPLEFGQADSKDKTQNPMTWINANKIKGDIPKEAILFAIEHLENQSYIDRGGDGRKTRGTSKLNGEVVSSRLLPSANEVGSYEHIVNNSDIGSWDDDVDKNVYNNRGKEARNMALRNGQRLIKNKVLNTNDPMELQLAHLIRKGHTLSEAKRILLQKMQRQRRIMEHCRRNTRLLTEPQLNKIINEVVLHECLWN